MIKAILKIEIILSLTLFLVLLLFTFNLDITGNSGDSITHYLYSHFAFKYPHFFLHHWAKPLFVLLSSPFAQFGFKGIIIFNSICITLTALFSFYTAKNFKIENPLLVYVFIFFAPLCFKLIFSGLTEYLFALFLIIGIYLMSKSKYLFSIVIISFLPLIRSEGLLILGVFGCYLVYNKQYKIIPYLFTGQLLYTIIGAFYFNDILWVINKIPYANLGSPYGKGELLDFVHRLNYVIEKPIYFLLFIGSISILISFIRKGFKKNDSQKTILILGSFAVLFVAHSIFWWKGIFNSMGLPRVLIAVIPVIAIIALIGLQTITSKLKNSILKKTVVGSFILLICFYPFTNRLEGVVFNDELFVIEENRLIEEEVTPYIKKEFPDYKNQRLYFSHPYLSIALDIDYFNTRHHREIQHLQLDTIESNSIIIWDDWFSPIEGDTELELLKGKFNLIQSFQRQDKERIIQFIVFEKKNKH
ncbi:MAG: hypothetical protein JKX68_03275 [Flavobacteriales bacterium]|nr:hypothetical protein [Flavobacteriales bacterium]